jgi:hypothetical protein
MTDKNSNASIHDSPFTIHRQATTNRNSQQSSVLSPWFVSSRTNIATSANFKLPHPANNDQPSTANRPLALVRVFTNKSISVDFKLHPPLPHPPNNEQRTTTNHQPPTVNRQLSTVNLSTSQPFNLSTLHLFLRFALNSLSLMFFYIYPQIAPWYTSCPSGSFFAYAAFFAGLRKMLCAYATAS